MFHCGQQRQIDNHEIPACEQDFPTHSALDFSAGAWDGPRK